MNSDTNSDNKVIQVDVEKLQFDLANPRFKGLSSQQEALHSFCNQRYARKTVNLAENIGDNGLNPSELLIVIRGPKRGEYIVLEGNRRLAALKLLSLPARLSDSPLSPGYRSKVRRFAQSADIDSLRRVACRLLGSREEANGWIALKHTGENDGIGVVGWDGEETARFRGTDPGYRLLDFVKDNTTLSNEAVAGLSRFPITNLERLLGDPEARKRLGISLDKGELFFLFDPSDVLRGLKKVVEDLAKRDITVTGLKLKDDRAAYLDEIEEFLPSGPTLSDPIDLGGSPKRQTAQPETKPTNRTGIRKTRSDLERKTLVHKNCNLPITVARIKEVFLEMRRLNADLLPNAAAAMLRIFIDTSTLEYSKKRNLPLNENDRGQSDLKGRISAVLTDIQDRTGEREACSTARNALLQPNGAIPIDRLHLNVHGRYELPQPDNLRIGWQAIEPWMKVLWRTLDGLANPTKSG